MDDVQMGGVELDDIELGDISITEDTKLLLKGFEPLLSTVEMCKVAAEVDSFSLTVTGTSITKVWLMLLVPLPSLRLEVKPR